MLGVQRSRMAWAVAGLLFVAALAYVAYSFVGTLVLALFVYYVTRPVYDRVRRRVSPPSLAAAVSLSVLALPAVLLLVYAVAIALREFGRFTATTDLGQYERAATPYLNVSSAVRDPAALLNDPSVVDAVLRSAETAGQYLGFISTGLLHLFVTFAIAFYLLRDGHRLSRWARQKFGDDQGVLDSYVRAVDTDLRTVFFGNILNAIFTAAIGAITYSVLDAVVAPPGIPYPALLGMLAGVASLVPVVGMKLVYVPVSAGLFAREALAADPHWGLPIAFAALSFVVVDTIPDLVLRPYVSGRDLHVGLVMFAYIFGPLLFGWYGIFLGPLILVLVVHFGRIVLPELLGAERLRPFAVDPGVVSGPDESAESDPEQAADEPRTVEASE